MRLLLCILFIFIGYQANANKAFLYDCKFYFSEYSEESADLYKAIRSGDLERVQLVVHEMDDHKVFLVTSGYFLQVAKDLGHVNIANFIEIQYNLFIQDL